MRTTRSFSILPSTWQHGMPIRNFGCILPTLSAPFDRKQRSLGVNSVITPKCVPSIRPSRYWERPLPATDVKPQRPRTPLLLLRNPTHLAQDPNPIRARAPNHSTLRPTRFTHWAIMRTTLSGLAQQTASPHNRYILLPSIFSVLTITTHKKG